MGFTNTPTLETERLLLRRFSENDLYALFKIHSDKRRKYVFALVPITIHRGSKPFS